MFHTFENVLQGVVTAEVGEELPPPPHPERTRGEGSGDLATPPTLRMQGGGRFGPPSDLGGGGLHEGAHGGALHPPPDLVEGAPLLPASLRGKVELQRLPSTLGIFQEHVSIETIHGPSLR